MPYLSKLPKRLALIRASLFSGALLIAACTDAESPTATSIDSTAPASSSVSAASIVVTPTAVSLTAGDSIALNATVRDRRGRIVQSAIVTWASSSPAVASVSAQGVVRGVGAGSATIEARSGRKSAFVAVTVLPRAGPGTVLDLTVVDRTASSLTLSFTAVSDGAGGGANYAMRAATPSLTWNSSTNATSGTCATPIRTGAVGSRQSCTLTGLVAGTAYQVQLVAFRGTWDAAPVLGALSNLASGSTLSATVPPVADSSYPNQPGGFAMLYNRPMSALSESGWGFRDYSVASNNVQGTRLSIVNQSSAPRSAPSVMQFTYPAGFAGGGEPAKTWREFPTSEFSPAMYMSLWVRFSANWDGHASSVNKIVYWQMTTDPNGRARLFLQGRGTNAQNLEAYLVTQGTPLGDQRLLAPNLVPGAQFVRDRWHRVEVIVRMNTGSNFDGQVHMWLDGTKITQYTDVIFASAAEDRRLSGFEVTPIWGGAGDQIGTQAQFLWVDHLYLSRQP